MAYQIRKGWPAQAAIDETFTAATNNTITEGMIVALKANAGKMEGYVPTSATLPSTTYAFVIGWEPQRKTWVGLMSQCVIEVDTDHYVSSDSLVVNSQVTVSYASGSAGKFALYSSSDTDAVPVGRVLSKDSSGNLRILWYASK